MSQPSVILAAVAANDDLANGQILSWDLTTGMPLHQHVWKEAAVLDATMIPSRTNPFLPAHFASTAIRTSALHIHSLQKERPVSRWYGHENICAMGASPDGRWLAAGNEKGGLFLWELESGRLYTHLVDAHLSKIHRVCFSRDGAALATVSEDGFCKVWTVESLILGVSSASALYSFSDHSKGVIDAHFGWGRSFRSSRLLTASTDGTCILYDLADGARLGKFNFPAPLTGCLMNATETLILASAVNGNIYLVDIGSDAAEIFHNASIKVGGQRNEQVLPGNSNSPITRMAFTADEAFLVTGDASGIVTVWNISGRMTVRQINTGPLVPGGSIRWIQVVPKVALTRNETVRAFGQLRRGVDVDAPITIDTYIHSNMQFSSAEHTKPSSSPTEANELERLREENAKLKEAHRRLLESIESSL